MRVRGLVILCAVAAAALAVPATPASAAAVPASAAAVPAAAAPAGAIHAAPRTVAPKTPNAAGPWQWQSPSPSGAPLYGVTCPTIGVCYAAGTFGAIELTTDRGQTWTSLISGVSDLITGISCFDDATCVAVDVAGDALRTADGGATWNRVSVSGGVPLNSVSCAYENPAVYPEECMAAGDSGVVYRTTDFGATWTQLTTGTTANLYGVSCWAWSRCPVAGAGGTILMPVNDGASWNVVNSTVTVDLYALSCTYTGAPFQSDPLCMAVGQNGTSVTGNLIEPTWSAAQIPGAFGPVSEPALLGVDCQAGCAVTGADGFVYSEPSPDWNATLLQYTQPWLASYSGAAGALRAISCTGLNTSRQQFLAYQCMAVGDYSTVAGTTNDGSAWNPRPPGQFHPYGPIACASTTACVAVSNPVNAPNTHTTCDPNGQCYFLSPPGAIAHTGNGGVTWPIVPLPGNPNITAVACPTATECIGVGNPGFCQSTTVNCEVVIASADGGATWSSLSTGQGASLSGISCPSTSICFASGDGGTVISTADAGAHWTAHTTGTTQNVNSISCPSTTTCFGSLSAVNIGPQAGAVISTTDGGTTWHSTSISGSWGDIDCPSTTTCYLIGSTAVMVSADGGATWTDRSPPANTYTGLYQIACPAVNVCYLLGQGPFDLTTDGGLHWTPTGTGNSPGFSFVSCPSTSTCFGAGANGALAGTTNSGSSWTQMAPYTFTPTRTDLHDVTCPSSTVCYAVSGNHLVPGGFVLESVDSGLDWFAVNSDLNYTPSGISCPNATTCFVASGGSGASGEIRFTTDAGATWTIEPPVTEPLTNVICASTSTCIATSTSSTVELRTTDGGSTWTSITAPATFIDVSCPSTTVCYAIANQNGSGAVYESTDAGQTWNLNFAVAGDPNAGVVQPFTAITCPNTTTCYAVGSGGLIAATSDATDWHTDSVPAAQDFTDVSCPSAGTCFASSAYFVDHTSDFGGTWDQQIAATTANVYRALSCPTTTLCVGVGDSGLASYTAVGGQEWSHALPVETTNTVMSLSCPDASNCYGAAFDTIVMSHDGGSTWTQHTFTSSDQVIGMACPSTGVCFAVGWPGAIYHSTNSGATWTYEANVLSGTDETLASVSCTSATSCVAVGTDGNVLSTADGLAWTRATPAIKGFVSVACPSAGACVAVGAGGMAYVLSAGSWHPETTGTTANLDAVSCPSPSVCFATGQAGTVIVSRNGGINWTAESSGTTAGLLAVSCPFTTVCLAVGGGGTLAFTRDGTSWASEPTPTPATLHAVVLTSSDQAWIAGAGGSILENPSAIPVPCQNATLTPSAASPGATGATITLTGSSTACTYPQYRFWVRNPGGTWKIVQDYSAANAFVWQSPATGAAGTYSLEVDVRDASSAASYDTVASATYVLNPCTAATLAAGPPSPQTAGTAETLSAGSTCPGTAAYRFWIRPPGGAWGIVQDYGAANTYAWNTSGKAAGTYYLEVDVRNQGATASYEATRLISFSLSSLACSSVTLGASPASPGATGSSVTFTGTASGCPSPQYRFWISPPGGGWTVVQNYGSANTFVWTATAAAGTYRFEVDARDASSAASYDAVANTSYLLSGCTAAHLATDKPSPQLAGTGTVTLIGSSTCPGTPDYRFWIRPPGGAWTVVQDYSPTATYAWSLSGQPAGSYGLEVDVRDHGSADSYDAVSNSTFVLGNCIGATLTPNPASPQPHGTAITLTGSATCTGTPEYRFWVRAPGGAWMIVRDYSTTNTFTWTPSTAGTYSLEVDVRNPGTSVSYETVANATYQVN